MPGGSLGISRLNRAAVLREMRRTGQYRKQNLITRYGSDIRLPDMPWQISKRSAWPKPGSALQGEREVKLGFE